MCENPDYQKLPWFILKCASVAKKYPTWYLAS